MSHLPIPQNFILTQSRSLSHTRSEHTQNPTENQGYTLKKQQTNKRD